MAKQSVGKKLLVVESPTKARTIRKFLSKDYVVESCMGHVRDLPQSAKDIPEKFKKQSWASLGVNVDQDFDPVYCVPRNKLKIVQSLKKKLADVDELILATDEDREGESISWHLLEVLKPKVPSKRMVFHEITKDAIQESLNHFREIDYNLVRAQEARRILDRLVGYTLSPLIWKKIAYGLSAGRVQSVALRLIVEREHERLRFRKAQYWSISADNEKSNVAFESRLIAYKGLRVATGKDFDPLTGELVPEKAKELLHLDAQKASQVQADLKGKAWKVTEVEEKPISRKPAPPFITSTLQQEANRKLGMGSRETMQVAQSLYEQGFITYMRTDSVTLSQQAIQAARSCIQKKFGKDFLPPEARTYESKKVKGAQEAHEAIRPAGVEFITPEDTGLSGRPFQLYDLIWKRTVASQMVNSQQKQVGAKFAVGNGVFAASGMTIVFPGFLRAYVEGRDDADAALEEREIELPPLKEGDTVVCKNLQVADHETKPAARYTEASLVQVMEKEGIGRPSTYASIIGTIIDRGYVRKVGNALMPTFTAMVVSNLLAKHFPEYVDTSFTSHMEESLDTIAAGELDWIGYLKSVYFGKSGLKSQVEIQEKKIDPDEARSINLEGLKNLSFRVGRYGAYVCRQDSSGEEVCASLPESQPPADITAEIANKLIDQKVNGHDALGKDPNSGLPVYVLTGRYGPYVQLGDSGGEKEKPKRVSIPAGIEVEQVDLKLALNLLSLPKTLGSHPESNKEIKAGLGRFGPFVVHDGDFRSIPKNESVFDITLERALELFSQPKRGRGRSAPLRELGEHPKDKTPVVVMSGRYGPYIKWGKVNASLGDTLTPDQITLDQALQLLEQKVGASPTGAESEPETDQVAKKAAGPKAKLNVLKPGQAVKTRKGAVTKKAKSSSSSKDKLAQNNKTASS